MPFKTCVSKRAWDSNELCKWKPDHGEIQRNLRLLRLITSCFIALVRLCQSAPATAPREWKQQGPAIVGKGRNYDLSQSFMMALSADARRMVIGFPGKNNCSGCIEVYHTGNDDENCWTRLGDAIYGTESTVNITEDEDYDTYTEEITS